jgi:WD40 repeat protein
VGIYSDQKWIVSGDENGAIMVWDLRNGRKIRQLSGAVQPVRALDSPGILWELTGPSMRAAGQQEVAVTGFAVFPDGKRLVSGSTDRTIKIWDLTGEGQVTLFAQCSGPVRGIALSADERLLISAQSDGSLQAWDVASGYSLARLTFDAPLFCCDIGADLRTIVVGSVGFVGFLGLEGMDRLSPDVD